MKRCPILTVVASLLLALAGPLSAQTLATGRDRVFFRGESPDGSAGLYACRADGTDLVAVPGTDASSFFPRYDSSRDVLFYLQLDERMDGYPVDVLRARHIPSGAVVDAAFLNVTGEPRTYASVAFSRDFRLAVMVVQRDGGETSVQLISLSFDVPTEGRAFSLSGTVDAPAALSGAALAAPSPDGRLVAVVQTIPGLSSGMRARISMYTPESGGLVSRWEGSSMPSILVWKPDSSIVYFPTETYTYRLPATTGNAAQAALGRFVSDFSPDGRLVALFRIDNGRGIVSTFSVADMRATTLFDDRSLPGSVNAAFWLSNDLLLFDTGTPMSGHPLVWSLSGRRFTTLASAFAAASVAGNVSSSGPARSVGTPAYDPNEGSVYSQAYTDRDWIAFTGGGGTEIPAAVYLGRPDGSDVVAVPGTGELDFFPGYDPDQRTVYVVRRVTRDPSSPSRAVFGSIDAESGRFTRLYEFNQAFWWGNLSVHYSPSLRFAMFQYTYQGNELGRTNEWINRLVLFNLETRTAMDLNTSQAASAHRFLCFSPNEGTFLTYEHSATGSGPTAFLEYDTADGEERTFASTRTGSDIHAVYRSLGRGDLFFSDSGALFLWSAQIGQDRRFGVGDLISGNPITFDGYGLLTQTYDYDQGTATVYEIDAVSGNTSALFTIAASGPIENVRWLPRNSFVFDNGLNENGTSVLLYDRTSSELFTVNGYVPNAQTAGRWRVGDAVACPFVDVRTASGFVRQGAVLVHLRSRDLEATQSISLSRVDASDGRVVVRIAEEEAETSFLDSVTLLSGGLEFRPVGAPAELGADDGRRLVLRQGESVGLVFETGAASGPFVLSVRGYYLPDGTW